MIKKIKASKSEKPKTFTFDYCYGYENMKNKQEKIYT